MPNSELGSYYAFNECLTLSASGSIPCPPYRSLLQSLRNLCIVDKIIFNFKINITKCYKCLSETFLYVLFPFQLDDLEKHQEGELWDLSSVVNHRRLYLHLEMLWDSLVSMDPLAPMRMKTNDWIHICEALSCPWPGHSQATILRSSYPHLSILHWELGRFRDTLK